MVIKNKKNAHIQLNEDCDENNVRLEIQSEVPADLRQGYYYISV